MTLQQKADEARKKGSVFFTRTGGRVHQSACGYDIELFRKWLNLSIKLGTDTIKVVAGDKPNTWVVSIYQIPDTGLGE